MKAIIGWKNYVLAVDLARLKRPDLCHEDLISVMSFSVAQDMFGPEGLWMPPVPVCNNKMQRKIPGRSYPKTQHGIWWDSNMFKWQVGKSRRVIRSYPSYTCLDNLPISRCYADATGVLGTQLVVCQVQARNKRQLLQSFLSAFAAQIRSSSPISEWKTERDWIGVKSESPCVYHCNTCFDNSMTPSFIAEG